MGYKCPDCARQDAATTQPRDGGGASPLQRLLEQRRGAGSDDEPPAPSSTASGTGLPWSVGARATAVGLAVATGGGLLIGPVLSQGAFFLISAGVLGWLTARAVYWATEEANSPFVRALALSVAFLMVLVGHVSASGGPDTIRELAFLAYPAALYGGWIVVRQR